MEKIWLFSGLILILILPKRNLMKSEIAVKFAKSKTDFWRNFFRKLKYLVYLLIAIISRRALNGDQQKRKERGYHSGY